MTDLPESDGYDWLMVVVDHGLTKGAILIPCNKNVTGAETAELYIKYVYKRFGLPDFLISDRGAVFASKVFKEMGKHLNIKLAMSSSYHPQTDGETERVNQDIGAYLRLFCMTNPEKWLELLPVMEFAHNNRVHSVTRQTPFYLMNGTEPRSIPPCIRKIQHPISRTPIGRIEEGPRRSTCRS